jgi:hypothetical protein
MLQAAAEVDPDVSLALVCSLADTLVVPVFVELLRPHEHLLGMFAVVVSFLFAIVISRVTGSALIFSAEVIRPL